MWLRMLIFLGFGVSVGWADSWAPATKFERFSASSNHVAQITPGRKPSKPQLTVYSLKKGKRSREWSVELSNHTSPTEVAISDDGRHVITFDNWAAVGYGPDVVAIYNRRGQVKKYSLEALFPEVAKSPFRSKITHSTSSRWWREDSIGFFDGTRPSYSLWLDWDSRWITWDLRTGAVVPVSESQRKHYDHRGRMKAQKEARAGSEDLAFYRFLGRLHQAADKPLVAALLKHRDSFYYSGYTTTSGPSKSRFFTYVSESHLRREADIILTNWGQPRPQQPRLYDEPYTFLGSLHAIVRFPTAPTKDSGRLIVCLLDKSAKIANPIDVEHRLIANLDYFYPQKPKKLWAKVNFTIRGITPGSYQVVAIWDKAKPHNDKPPFRFTRGDYLTAKPVPVDIKAGILQQVSVECLKPVP